MSEYEPGEPRTSADTPGRRMAYVLRHWPESRIRRDTLRAFLPAGATRRAPDTTIAARRLRTTNPTKSQNLTTRRFKSNLAKYESLGYIKRDDEWVYILARGAFEQSAAELVVPFAAWIQETLDAYRAEAAAPDPETRRQELLAIQRLMEDPARHRDAGAGSVRIVPRGRTL